MTEIERASNIGFCLGVRRALKRLDAVVSERGAVETLGAVVHNQQVLQRLAESGVSVVRKIEDIKGDTVVISSHGVSPDVEEALRERHIEIVNTTCPFVRRAQVAARRLAEAGFFVIIYGDGNHPEVKGILGWAGGQGLATLDAGDVARLDPLPRHLGILSQTTQIPAGFAEFAREIIDLALGKDAEIRVIDTICHDFRERQEAALELARRADLMLVVGGRSSANTNRLAEICSGLTETHLVETAGEIAPAWLKGKKLIGVTAGASTAEETVDEVVKKLEDGAA